MKKTIALSLSILTIIISGWMIFDQIKMLDLIPNYTDTYASLDKQKIDERTDITEGEKKILRNQIDQDRANKTKVSGEAFGRQLTLSVIIIIQLILFFVILMMPKLKNSRESVEIGK